MLLPVRYNYVEVQLRPHARLHLSASSPAGPPYYGAALWIMPDGTIQLSGVGLRLRNVVREQLKGALVPELRILGAEAARLAVALEAKATAAGLNLPVVRVQTGGLSGAPGVMTFLEMGRVGAGSCTFGLATSGGPQLRVPPRPAPAPGRPLAPITIAAQTRWDHIWGPPHGEAIQRLLGADVDAGLRRIHAAALRLPTELDFG